MPTTKDPRTLADNAAHEWLLPLDLSRPSEIANAVVDVATHFAGEPGRPHTFGMGRDHAYVDLQPGNGTAYKMHIVLLSETVGRSLGYRMLIALPDFNTCLALDAFGFHVPWYIAEKAPALGAHGHAILAAFTTQLSAHLDYLLNP